MSEGGEKTELPTPKKTRDAREKGQVARSQEIVTAVSLASVVAYVWFSWSATLERLVRLVDQMAFAATLDFETTVFPALLFAATDSSLILLPPLAVAIIAAIVANCFQFGIMFAMESIMPKMEKINPASGMKRIFSLKQLVELIKSILKILFLSILLYIVIKRSLSDFMYSATCGLHCLAWVTSSALGSTLVYSGLAFALVAAADFAYQRHTFTKSLMMSKDEVKREYKESEGDPVIKGKRKQLAQELVVNDSGHAARRGTAVVVNPTHYAVVISYRPEELALPIVTAKGRNAHAHYLRSEAETAGVPIFRHVQLARSLFASTEVAEVVPEDLFDVVAEILAWVNRNRELLYNGPLTHGVIDMDAGDHKTSRTTQSGRLDDWI